MLCKFGQICATEIVFVRLIVGRNSILNFPAKIWTGICRALQCDDDSSHSQGQSGKRLLLASRGHPIRTGLYHRSCIDPMHPPHTLDPTPDPPLFISQLPIQLLIKDEFKNGLTCSSLPESLLFGPPGGGWLGGKLATMPDSEWSELLPSWSEWLLVFEDEV